jgi:hypothetical protein
VATTRGIFARSQLDSWALRTPSRRATTSGSLDRQLVG